MTGVQTCALPISAKTTVRVREGGRGNAYVNGHNTADEGRELRRFDQFREDLGRRGGRGQANDRAAPVTPRRRERRHRGRLPGARRGQSELNAGPGGRHLPDQRALPVLIRVPGAGVISRPDLAPAAPVDPSAAPADRATTAPATASGWVM